MSEPLSSEASTGGTTERGGESRATGVVEPTPVLDVRDVFRFHEVDGKNQPILRGVSFALAPGSFTTIMGPSGSGKSTLLHLLAGMDLPSSGAIDLMGESLSSRDETSRTRLRRRHIGFIFQFFNLLPDLTVEENVALPLRIAGERAERHATRVSGLLERLGIAQLRTRLPSRLSGGEMQRVSIARALVTAPPLLLCDEPTGNLSSKAGEEIVTLLRSICDAGDATVLLVTHNPRDAAIGDRVLFLHDGSLAQSAALTGPGLTAHDVHQRLEQLGI